MWVPLPLDIAGLALPLLLLASLAPTIVLGFKRRPSMLALGYGLPDRKEPH